MVGCNTLLILWSRVCNRRRVNLFDFDKRLAQVPAAIRQRKSAVPVYGEPDFRWGISATKAGSDRGKTSEVRMLRMQCVRKLAGKCGVAREFYGAEAS